MNQENINRIQDKVIKLLNSQGNGRLNALAIDCCSEMTRLVGGWIQELQKFDKLLIIKGQNIKNSNHSHDVLAIFENKKVSVIDPTVWQFFPDKDIFVGEFGNLEETFPKLSKIYGGKWEIGEKLNSITDTQKRKWGSTIKQTLRENISKRQKANNSVKIL